MALFDSISTIFIDTHRQSVDVSSPHDKPLIIFLWFSIVDVILSSVLCCMIMSGKHSLSHERQYKFRCADTEESEMDINNER